MREGERKGRGRFQHSQLSASVSWNNAAPLLEGVLQLRTQKTTSCGPCVGIPDLSQRSSPVCAWGGYWERKDSWRTRPDSAGKMHWALPSEMLPAFGRPVTGQQGWQDSTLLTARVLWHWQLGAKAHPDWCAVYFLSTLLSCDPHCLITSRCLLSL